jgi:hypothetical protein
MQPIVIVAENKIFLYLRKFLILVMLKDLALSHTLPSLNVQLYAFSFQHSFKKVFLFFLL